MKKKPNICNECEREMVLTMIVLGKGKSIFAYLCDCDAMIKESMEKKETKNEHTD